MSGSIQQLSSALSWAPTLSYQLLPNKAATTSIDRDGVVHVKIPTARPRWHIPPITWIVRIPAEKTLELDTLGQHFWTLCQSGTTVEALIDQFADELNLSFHEARMTITTFAVQLVQRGALVVITTPPKESERKHSS